MKKLETKYRNDELSPAELQELRNRIKSMSDYEIGEEMYQTWMNEKIDVTSVPDKQIDKIKAQIENSIKEEKSNGFDFSRIIQIAPPIPGTITMSFSRKKRNFEHTGSWDG